MAFPSFFSEVPPIIVHDRLAEFLGASDGGVIEYRYADAVKLAGHSCPTVAGTYLMTSRALAALYPDELPERGEIQVDFRDAQEEGTTGVMAAIVGMITGAAGVGGFKGIAGHFSRRNLLDFDESASLVRSASREEIAARRSPPRCILNRSHQTRASARFCNGYLAVITTRSRRKYSRLFGRIECGQFSSTTSTIPNCLPCTARRPLRQKDQTPRYYCTSNSKSPAISFSTITCK